MCCMLYVSVDAKFVGSVLSFRAAVEGLRQIFIQLGRGAQSEDIFFADLNCQYFCQSCLFALKFELKQSTFIASSDLLNPLNSAQP